MLLTSEQGQVSVLTADDKGGQAGPVGYEGIEEGAVGTEDEDGGLLGGRLTPDGLHLVAVAAAEEEPRHQGDAGAQQPSAMS